MPESLADGGRFDAFMAHIRRGLSPCPVQPGPSRPECADENDLTPHLSPGNEGLPSVDPGIDCDPRCS
jgi:hypothetical protein